MRLLFRLIAGLIGFASATGVSEAGYLSTVGPAPLRFAAPRTATARYTMPPLPADRATVQPPMPAAAELAPVTISTQSPFFVPPLGLGLPPAAPDQSGVTPQALVEVYKQNSACKDQRDPAVVVPINFVPPSPPPPQPSSTATYQIR